MKKLLISIVATASLALVAKADVLNSASFENYIAEKFSVGLDDGGNDGGELYWSGGGTDPEFEWVTRGEGEGASNALSIDVEEELVRKVKADGTALNIGDGLYFDSMVQFTATEDAPEVTEGDKLIVWLKEIPGEGESATSTYKLCVTAAELSNEAVPSAKVFESTKEIEPNSWHRLTIATRSVQFGDAQGLMVTKFQVYLDSEPILEGDDLYSLVSYQASDYNPNKITSVSFKGKGAIDDLVWTTEDPIAPETKSYTVIVNDSVGSLIGSAQYQIGEADEVSVSLYDGETDETADFALTVPVDATSVTFFLAPGDDYEVEDGTFVNDRWVVTVTLPEAGSQITLKIIEKQVEEPVVKPFTVTIDGVDTPFETLDEAIADAGGAPIKLTEDATLIEKLTVAETAVIDLNGQTLTLANDQGYAVVVKGALTIKDSVGGGVINVPGSYGFGIGTFIENIDAPGSLTVEGGSIIGTKAEYLIGVFVGNATIEGGNFEASYCCLNAIGKYDATGVLIDATCATATVTGGRFTVAETDTSVDWDIGAILGQDNCVAVSGGTFNVPLMDSFCAEGYIPTTEPVDSYYTVVLGYAVTVEATNATVTGLAAKYAAGATVSFTVKAAEDYEVTMNGTPLTADNGTYSFEMPATAVTIVVTTEAVNNEPEYPEVDAEEGEEVTESFSDEAKAVIKDAFTVDGVYTKPSAPLAVEVNGEALKGNAAINMINEVVEKFSGNPFTNGKLELTFKVTDVMKALTGDAQGYNLTVGNAQLKTTYKVVPKYIDLATKVESLTKPTEGAVIFKLSIEPVAAE